MKKIVWKSFLCFTLLAGMIGGGHGLSSNATASEPRTMLLQNEQGSYDKFAVASQPAKKFPITKKSKEYLNKGLLFGFGVNFKMNKKQMIKKFGPITDSYEYEGIVHSFKKLENLAFSFNGTQEEGSIFSVLMGSRTFGKIDVATMKKAWGLPNSEGPSDDYIGEDVMFYDFGHAEVHVFHSSSSTIISSILIIVR